MRANKPESGKEIIVINKNSTLARIVEAMSSYVPPFGTLFQGMTRLTELEKDESVCALRR